MCGIAGIIDPSIKSEDLRNQVVEMLTKTIHRGPDNMGSWVNCQASLGHNRLKVIDLSDNANQPFEYGDFIITFNGEIYNFLELREVLKSKGHVFDTKSDTEVVVASFKEWGINCVEHFVGMWAFALWDKKKNELFCSRDRFGIKPFYYIHSGDKFYFSSEYKALKNISAFNRNLNIDQVNRGLILGWASYFDETYYEQIKNIPAGHNLIFKDGSIKIWQYWDLSANASKSDLNASQKVEKFYSLFEDSIKIHSRSDVNIGACLSGGIDSSSIASMYSQINPEKSLKTFTIYYEGKGNVDERPFVQEVVNKYSNIEPHYFSPSDEDIISGFDKAMYYSDIPLLGSSFMSQYFLMKMASQNNIKVLLDGQGSDEYLLGYLHSFGRLIGNQFKGMRPDKALGLLLSHKAYHDLSAPEALLVLLKGVYSSMNNEQDVYSREYKKLFPYLSNTQNKKVPLKLEKKSDCKVDNFLYHMLFNTSLPTLLFYEDRNSMAFSIESRVPFLDHRLVEFIYSLPHDDKINKGAETKYMLRNSMKNVLPATITNRKDKKGFNTPGENTWLRGPLNDLLDIDYNNLYWMDKKSLKSMVDDYKKGNNSNSKLVWRVATLNYWLKNHH